MLARTKKTDAAITVAVIVAVAGIIGAYLQSPLADTQFQERPIIGVSFSDWMNHQYPKEVLESDGTNYFIKLLAQNTGNSNGKIIATVVSEGATISFFENDEFSSQKSLRYTIKPFPNYTTLAPPIFVKPDPNSQRFSIEIFVEDGPNKNPFQELDPYIPTKLVYEPRDGDFILIDKK